MAASYGGIINCAYEEKESLFSKTDRRWLGRCGPLSGDLHPLLGACLLFGRQEEGVVYLSG